jgi:hypothetical protein
MVQVLRLLRRLPVAEKIQDIAIFINRELLPFLQELRESTAATFEQVTTNTLLGRDTPGTGDVEEISLDDTLEFTGSQVIQRAAITGDVTIPAGSNVSTVPALPGLQSAIDAVEADIITIQNDVTILQTDVNSLESAEYVTYSSNAALSNERVLTAGTNTTINVATANQIKIDVTPTPAFVTDGDKGDITVSASGATWTIDNDVVTFAKMQNIGNASSPVILCRTTATAGDTVELSVTSNSVPIRSGVGNFISQSVGTNELVGRGSGGLGTIPVSSLAGDGLTSSGVILSVGSSTSIAVNANDIQRAALTGDVTASANSNATTIANDAVTTVKILNANVTLPKLATQAARTVVSNNTLATATPTAVLHTDIIIRPDLLDCFVGGNSSTTLPMSALGWLYRDIAGTGSVTRDSGTGFGGVYRITTGSVANNACSFTLGSTSTLPILNAINFKYTEFVVDLSSTTNSRLQVGYMQNTDTATTGGTACTMFMFDTGVSANWITTTRSASTSTQKTSSIVVNTTIVKLGIATDFSGPTVRFYVNDVLAATHVAGENISNTEMNVGVRMETLTGSSRNCEISRFTAIRRLDGRDIPEV